MKVICLTHENFSGYPFHNVPKPDIGEEVTVIEESYYREVPTYILAEYGGCQYDQRWFGVKSDIDETKLVNKLEVEKV